MPGPLLDGRYRLLQPIGRSALAEVWQAADEMAGIPIAVKIFEGARDLNLSALQAAGALGHPHIVAVHDLGSDRGVPYVVMELVEGFSLATLLAEEPLPVADARAIAVQICQALEAAHAAGIVHGGLKPTNVLIGDGGLVKVTDFGISGTGDSRADAYQLGRLLQAMVAGSPEGESALRELIGQLLQPDGPGLTVAQVRERLLNRSDAEPDEPEPQSKLLRTMLISGAAAVVITIGMCVWFLLPKSPPMIQADDPYSPTASPTDSAGPSTTASPEPEPTTAAVTGTGVAAVRAVIREQLEAGQVKPDAARDLQSKLDEIARNLSKGQSRQAGTRVRAMQDQLAAMRRDNRVTADGYEAIRSALTQLAKTI